MANSVSRTLIIISGSLLLLGVVIDVANVVGRYILKAPITWAEEAMSYCIIASVFSALPALAWGGRHMRMDILISLLPSRSRSLLDRLADVALALFVIVFALFSIPVLKQVIHSGQQSEALHIPMVFPHALVPIGMGLMGVMIVLRLIIDLRKGAQSTH